MSAVRTGRSALPPSDPNKRQGLLAGLHIDLPLLIGLLLLYAVGLAVLYSASDGSWVRVEAQMARIGAALTALFVFAQIPPQRLRRWTPWLYLAVIAMLVAVLVFGHVGKGAQRWLDLGIGRFQPAEFAKTTVPMMMAWYFSRHPLPPGWKDLAIATLLVLVPVLLIAKEPDLGTALLVASAGVFVLFLAGVSWKLILGLGAALAAIAPLAWLFLMRDYQKQRVLTFLDPEQDPLGAGYHIIQSKIAIGSGGLWGKGFLNGTQSHLEFLPERTTDFIFAVIGEELGLAGILALMALFLFVILRGLYIATEAQDSYSRLLAGSLSLVLFVYLFVNTGMVTGLLPVVGVPLPFISFGGTSLLTLSAGLGILMSIHTHRKLLPQ